MKWTNGERERENENKTKRKRTKTKQVSFCYCSSRSSWPSWMTLGWLGWWKLFTLELLSSPVGRQLEIREDSRILLCCCCSFLMWIILAFQLFSAMAPTSRSHSVCFDIMGGQHTMQGCSALNRSRETNVKDLGNIFNDSVKNFAVFNMLIYNWAYLKFGFF